MIPAEDLVTAARSAIAEAAAQIRAMPDLELVALVASAREATRASHLPAEKTVKSRARGKQPEPPTSQLCGGRELRNHLSRALTAEWMGPSALLAATGVEATPSAVFQQMRQLVSEGVAERNGVGGRGGAYRRAARTKTTRKRAVKGADEEEGEPVLTLGRDVEGARPGQPRVDGKLRPAAVALSEPTAMSGSLSPSAPRGLSHRERRDRDLARLQARLHAVDDERPRLAPPVVLEDDKSGLRVLPMLELGRGERRDDCAHYDGCLGRHVANLSRSWAAAKPARAIGDPARHPADQPARCPASCSSFELVPQHVRHGLAHVACAQAKPQPAH